MVRLQHDINENEILQILDKSQFHYGSITTDTEGTSVSKDMRVSIPLWFDYNH